MSRLSKALNKGKKAVTDVVSNPLSFLAFPFSGLGLPGLFNSGKPEDPSTTTPPNPSAIPSLTGISGLSAARRRRLNSMRFGFASTFGDYKPPILNTAVTDNPKAY